MAQGSSHCRAELDEAFAATLLYEVTQKGHMMQAHTRVPEFPGTMPPGAASPEQRFETLPPRGHGDRCSEFRQAQGLRLCPGGGEGWGLLESGVFSHLPMPPRSHHLPQPCGRWRKRSWAGVLSPPHLAWLNYPQDRGTLCPTPLAPLSWRARCYGQLEGWPAWHILPEQGVGLI